MKGKFLKKAAVCIAAVFVTIEESNTFGKIVGRTGRKYDDLHESGFDPYKYVNIQN